MKFLERFAVGLGLAFGFTILGTLWIFMVLGFGGLIFLYNNVAPESIVGILIFFPIGYAALKTAQEARR